MGRIWRGIDLPPVWLAGALVLVWVIARLWPLGAFGAAGRVLGAGLVGLGLALVLVAAAQMTLGHTTFIPRRDPQALVTGGVFRLSRNPIYLGDAMVLLGAILWWDAPLALPLLPAFLILITRRFILDEETRLRAAFGAEFAAWAARTRRWL